MNLTHPKRIDDITAEWMNWAQRERGMGGHTNVSSIEMTSIGGRGGFLSEVARVFLTYDRPEVGLPNSNVWHDRLITYGVEGYSQEQVWRAMMHRFFFAAVDGQAISVLDP